MFIQVCQSQIERSRVYKKDKSGIYMGRVSAILPTTLYPRRKNNWKELGLNPGPLDLQATTLTTREVDLCSLGLRPV